MKNTFAQKRGTLRTRLLDILLVVIALVIVLYAVLIHLQITGSGMETIIASLLIGIVMIEILGAGVYYYFSKRITLEEAGPLRNLFRITAYIVLIIILLAELHINITGILVSAGFLGIVLGLAAQSTLSNFISGIYLISSKAFEPGDRVIIHTWQYTLQAPSYPHDRFVPGFAGVIKSIGVLYTELTNDEHLPMLVPNSIVAQAMIINYRRATEHMTRIQFDIDIRIKFSSLEKVIKDVIERNRSKIDDYNIDIDYLNNNLYVVTIRLRIEEKDRAALKTKIYTELIRYLNEEHNKLNRH